jgi:hypothetical protein
MPAFLCLYIKQFNMMKRIILCLFISLAAVAAATAQDTPKKQCTAMTQKNRQCLNKATIGDKCHVHGKAKCGDSGQLTGKGQPCKNPVKEKGLKCWRHS